MNANQLFTELLVFGSVQQLPHVATHTLQLYLGLTINRITEFSFHREIVDIEIYAGVGELLKRSLDINPQSRHYVATEKQLIFVLIHDQTLDAIDVHGAD